MRKVLYFILFNIVFLSGCQRNEVIKTHGIAYLEKKEKLIVVDKTNKNDTINILGYPATRGMTDDSIWIYIERSTTKGKLLKLGRSYLKKNNVLILEFNKFGVLSSKEFYDKEKMKNVNFAKKTTTNELSRENFIYSFLSSVRQKMESKKK